MIELDSLNSGSERGKREYLETSVIVLAGGRSRRLGDNKVMKTVGSKTLLEQVVFCVVSLSDEVIIVAAEERLVPQLTGYPNLRVVTDIYPGKGPLGGIYTGLKVSSAFCNLVVAADMPFLNQALLRYMLGLANGVDLVAPRVGGQVEPLHAVYTRGCLVQIEQMLNEGELGVHKLFPRVNVRYIDEEEIKRFDPTQSSFFNVNTGSDLQIAREIASKRRDND
ncbi:MAG: molybdenum cofactor guanylyltransferase [Dehalococcoidales bacterium]|nr:MAG: molybdenum cofactor guanylyltransferase [Dehalococcoidales bacterium]